MSYSPLLVRLIDGLRCMPGVGQKSAQRIAFHLLERDREGAGSLSSALADAVSGIGHCGRCRMFTEHELCSICSASGRDASKLCVVESPADVMAIEDATGFRGHYFVLMGHLSPLDGIGPDELGLQRLEPRTTWPSWPPNNRSRLAVSHTVFLWAVNSSTLMAVRFRTHFSVAGPWIDRRKSCLKTSVCSARF